VSNIIANVIMIGLLIVIVFQLWEVLGRLPARDYVKEAMERDRARKEEQAESVDKGRYEERGGGQR